MAVTAGISILVCCVLCKEEQRPEGPLERSLQNRVDLPPNDTARMGFTVDPLLQTRYLGAGGELRPWLPEAPSVFPDQQLAVSGSSGGFLSGKQLAVDIPDYQAVSVKGSQQLVALVALKTSYESSIAVPGVLYGFTTAVILAILAYSWWRWFSPSKCAALALGAAAHSQLQTTPLLSQAAPAAAAAAAGTSAPPAASGSPSKRSGSLSKHKSANGSLELVLPQQHAVPAGVSTPQQVARTVSAPQQASGGDRAPRALSHRHRVLTL
ncbi:hypothetical protein N2152v2_008469 [Parachlorella kessleri]